MRAASNGAATKFQLINEPRASGRRRKHEFRRTPKKLAGHNDDANTSSGYCLLKTTPSIKAHLITVVKWKEAYVNTFNFENWINYLINFTTRITKSNLHSIYSFKNLSALLHIDSTEFQMSQLSQIDSFSIFNYYISLWQNKGIITMYCMAPIAKGVGDCSSVKCCTLSNI